MENINSKFTSWVAKLNTFQKAGLLVSLITLVIGFQLFYREYNSRLYNEKSKECELIAESNNYKSYSKCLDSLEDIDYRGSIFD